VGEITASQKSTAYRALKQKTAINCHNFAKYARLYQQKLTSLQRLNLDTGKKAVGALAKTEKALS